MKLTTAFAAIAAVLLASPVSYASAKPVEQRVIFSCSAAGDTDISMSTRYVQRTKGSKVKKQFKAEFEAARNLGFKVGQKMTVLVKGVNVGSKRLVNKVNGDVGAELELESESHGVNRFPANFPAMAAGVTVEIQFNNATVLSCNVK